MSDVFSLLFRLVAMTFAFILAAASAGFFFTLSLAGLTDPDGSLIMAEHWFTIIPLAIVVGSTAASLALMPFMIFAGLCEYFSWRGLVLHLIFGAMIGAFSVQFWERQAIDPTSKAMLAGAAAGTVAGFVYWLLAGRNAGKTFTRIVNGPVSSESGQQTR